MNKSKFLEKYGKEHIIVYLGVEVQIKMNPKPITPGKRMARMDASSVYIDGMNYGSAKRPFSCFEVDPGTHKLEVEARFDKKAFVTDAIPVRVKGDSVMVALKAVQCLSGIYWEIKQFTDIDEFLAHIGEDLEYIDDYDDLEDI